MDRGLKQSLRDRVLPFLGARASRFVAARLLQEGGAAWSADPRRILEAIDKVERAWTLDRDPEIAIQLAILYDRANRNDDALVVLGEASRENPLHARLRYHTAITLLRHGTPTAIGEFFRGVLKVDANDAFARFVTALLDRHDEWALQLAESMKRTRQGWQPFLIAIPVWGEGFATFCMRHLCASLLSANNLPALAKRHPVHIAFFTSPDAEQALRAEPLFYRLEEHATIDIVHYPSEVMAYKASMAACYGHEKVPYSGESLAFYYERNCKFALMSCAHYVGLSAGCPADALVSCMVADVMVNDGALTTMAARMGQADAVLAHAIQMHGKNLRPLMDRQFRDADGVLSVSGDECARLVVDYLPADNLADSGQLMDPPLRLAWRVGDDGLLIHGNHYHPYCLRPKALGHSLRLSIDPVDSRFLDRTSLDTDRIHLVQDSSVIVLSIDDDPILQQRQEDTGGPLVPRFALWLWGYWGPRRGWMFRAPLRYGSTSRREEWQRVEATASALVDAIVADAELLEEANTARKRNRRDFSPTKPGF
jgi:hypothetical protein